MKSIYSCNSHTLYFDGDWKITYYIRLIKFTEKGAKKLKEFPIHRLEFLSQAKKSGIKVHGTYITLGKYDMDTILEAENENAILKLHTSYVGPHDRTSTVTLTAVTADEFEKIIN